MQLAFLRRKSKMDYDTRLINLVKEHPELYDVGHWDFKNKDVKNEVWGRIAFELRQDHDSEAVRLVKMRWKSLRDAYVKETKYRSTVVKDGEVKPRKFWRYYSAMSFLAPYLGPPCPAKGFRFKKHFHEGSILERVENYFATSEDIKEESQDACGRPPVDIWTPGRHFLGPLCDNQDDIDSFFKGVADTVKKLTPVNQIKVQRDIVNMILDVKLKETKENDNSSS